MPKHRAKSKTKKPHGPRRIKKGEAGYGKKKFVVRVRTNTGSVKTVKFGDPNMEIRRDNPKARANFRKRHNCASKTDKTKAGYWSCRMWSKKPVSKITKKK